MALSQQRKLTVIALLIYWPVLFIFAHIPIPELVYKAQVSDKRLHLLAYLVLVFLLWFALNPDKKVNWRKATVWWVLLVAVWYGVIDELLQAYVGRTCDVTDFLANLAGVLAGLILFTFLTFWPAFLVVTGIVVFLLANLARLNPAGLLLVTSGMFYLFAYGLFTMLWIRHMHLFLSLKAPQPKWLIGALVLPIVFLLSVEVFSTITGRGLRPSRAIISAIGIAAVVITIFLTALFRRRLTKKSSPSDLERSV
ncbi:MAG: VanZ family protein [Planctomycetota bacterium]|jgi:VanZ family protein